MSDKENLVQNINDPQTAAAETGAADINAPLPDEPEPGKDRLWSAMFILVALMSFCCFAYGQGLNSGTSIYISAMGGNATFSGLLAAVFSVAAAVSRLVCGPGVDSIGRRRILIVGFVSMFIGVLLPLIDYTPSIMVATRVFQGIGFSITSTAAATAAADVLPFSRMGEGIGYYGLSQALAMSIGPALALWLASKPNPTLLFVGGMCIAVLGFIFLLFITYEKHPELLPEKAAYHKNTEAKRRRASKSQAAAASAANDPASAPATSTRTAPAPEPASTPEKEPLWRKIFEPSAIRGVLPMVLMSTNNGFAIFFCGLYGTTLGLGNAGLFFTASAIVMIIVRLASKKFMDSVGPLKILMVSIFGGLVCYALLLISPHHLPLFYVAGLFYGLSMGLSHPLCQSVAIKATRPARYGAASALFLLSMDVGIGISSVIWGHMNDTAGFPTTIVCVMCCMVASGIVAWFSFPNHGMKPMKAREE